MTLILTAQHLHQLWQSFLSMGMIFSKIDSNFSTLSTEISMAPLQWYFMHLFLRLLHTARPSRLMFIWNQEKTRTN